VSHNYLKPACAKEDEPIAGTQEGDLLDLWRIREEGEGWIDEGHWTPRQVDEIAIVLTSSAAEEAL
jgi:hypothetical protein